MKIKSKNSETKESGFLAGNPEAYKKFNLKLKKHFKNEASRKRTHLKDIGNKKFYCFIWKNMKK